MRVLTMRHQIPVVIATATAPDDVVVRLRSELQLYDINVFQTSIDKPLLQTRFHLLHRASFRGAELVAADVDLPIFSGVRAVGQYGFARAYSDRRDLSLHWTRQ